jgi:hypothetical protein
MPHVDTQKNICPHIHHSISASGEKSIMKITVSKITLIFLFLLACVGIAQAQGRTATVISERANLRETPAQASEVKQEVAVGTSIKVLDRKGAWYVVRIDDSVGWMHGNTFRFGSGSGIQQSNSVLDDDASPSPAANTSRPIRSRSGSVQSNDSGSRSSSGRTLIRGPRGGCYYYSGSGRKVYVNRSLCN